MLRFVWWISLLFHPSLSNSMDLYFQIQPQLVRVNNLDDMYISNDEHFLGQVLYRYDRIQLACECQTNAKRVQWEIDWSVNNEKFQQVKNSTSIEFFVNAETVQAPITSVTCHCTFIQKNSTKIQRSYQYQLYIDLDSEPTLETIYYVIPLNMFKRRFDRFRHHPHFFIITGLLFVVIGTLGSLLIVKISSYYSI